MSKKHRFTISAVAGPAFQISEDFTGEYTQSRNETLEKGLTVYSN